MARFCPGLTTAELLWALLLESWRSACKLEYLSAGPPGPPGPHAYSFLSKNEGGTNTQAERAQPSAPIQNCKRASGASHFKEQAPPAMPTLKTSCNAMWCALPPPTRIDADIEPSNMSATILFQLRLMMPGGFLIHLKHQKSLGSINHPMIFTTAAKKMKQ